MPWVRIDDHFDEHPKFAKVGPLGLAMWVTGLAYCNRNLTDGFIPWTVARNLVNWEFAGPTEEDGRHKIWEVGMSCGIAGEDVTCKAIIPYLVDAGLWDEVEGGYQIHDYPDYQPTKEQVLAERKANADRQSRFRERKSNDVSNAVTNGPVTGNKRSRNEPPVPVPVPVPQMGDKPPKPPEPDEHAQRFERFWSVYPKRVGKDAARKAWDKRKPSAELTEQIVAAVNVQRQSLQWCKDGGQFIPNPATWLNQGRWQDDPAPDVPTLTVHQGSGSRASPKDEGMSKYDLAAYARELERRNA